MSRRLLVLVDPGHGGSDPGAIGPAGVHEATVNRQVAAKVVSRLDGVLGPDSGDRVVCALTRRGDESVSLRQRVEHAHQVDADLFLSLHCNAGPASAEGFEVWTSPGETAADRCATELWEAWGRHFPGRRRRLDTSDGDWDKEAGFYVLTRTRCPAVLLELGFISHPREELELAAPAHQAAMAEAVAEGVRRYLFGLDESMLRHLRAGVAAAAGEGLPPSRTCNMPEEDQSRIERLLLFLGRIINRRREERHA